MDIDGLVIAVASRIGVRAKSAESYRPLEFPANVNLSIIEVGTTADATRFADGCMTDGIPAYATTNAAGAPVVVILHD